MVTELEAKRHAKLREQKGKEPKIEKGERKAIERDNLVLGGMIENLVGLINYTELIVGQKMFLDFSAKLRDGRTLQMKLSDTTIDDSPIAEALANADKNHLKPEGEGEQP